MKYSILSVLLFLTGCIAIKPSPVGFVEKEIQTEHFSIAVWEKETIEPGKTLRIYIEGDGNPNPRHQIAKHFAEQDMTSNVVYVARPCQWSEDSICKKTPSIYQKDRFHQEVIEEMNDLLKYLTRKHKAQKVELIGYDGGAVIALNAAPTLPTSRIITIAGIVDTDAYASHNEVDLSSAENPAKTLSNLENISQIHYVGANDTNTPRRMVERFVAKMHNPKAAVVKVVPYTDHTDWKDVKLDY